MGTKEQTYMFWDFITYIWEELHITYYQKQETFSQLSFSYLGFIHIIHISYSREGYHDWMKGSNRDEYMGLVIFCG